MKKGNRDGDDSVPVTIIECKKRREESFSGKGLVHIRNHSSNRQLYQGFKSLMKVYFDFPCFSEKGERERNRMESVILLNR